MKTRNSTIATLLGTAVLAIAGTISVGAAAAPSGASVAVQTNALDIPFYLRAGWLAPGAESTMVDRASGREVAAQTNALDVPFYLRSMMTSAVPVTQENVSGQDVATATNMLEIPVYLRRGG